MYPDTVSDAECCSEGCYDAAENTHNQCEPVFGPTPMLWKTGNVIGGNICEWKRFQYQRAYACGCTRTHEN